MQNKALEKWEECKICDCCEVYQPQTISTKEMVENGAYPVFGANGQIGKYDNYNHEDAEVLVTCRGATCGSINMSLPKSWINGNAMVISPKKNDIDKIYLFYFLKNIDFSNYISGAAQPQITRVGLSPLVIKYPDLSEQQRLVKILDEAFENIEKAKQNALQNLNNAKELFESYLKEYFEITKNTWQKYKLSEITTKIGSGATPLGGKKAYIDCGISLIRSMNVYDREFIYEGLAHISEIQAKQLDVVTIQEKDVLLNITGASVARCCVVPNDVIPARVNQHVSIIRPKQEIILSKFLCYLLTSNYYKNILLKDGAEGGATRQALTKTGLEQFEVYIPKTLEEQQKIVTQLDELQEQTKKLEQIYEQRIKDLDELKQSILQKAFNGEL